MRRTSKLGSLEVRKLGGLEARKLGGVAPLAPDVGVEGRFISLSFIWLLFSPLRRNHQLPVSGDMGSGRNTVRATLGR